MSKPKIKIGKFVTDRGADDGTANIYVDDRNVGYVERVKSERFASASSRQRIAFVVGYTVVFWDDRVDEAFGDEHDFKTRAGSREFIEKVVEKFSSDLHEYPPQSHKQ